MDPFGYKQLIIWQLADKLAHNVYDASLYFPKEEIYGLTSQLRRAVLSVVLNIVEGYARKNINEFKNFLRISYGSLAETGYLLEFSYKRNYLTKEKYEKILADKEECARVLWKFMQSQRTKQ